MSDEKPPLSEVDVETLRNFSIGEPPFGNAATFEFSESTIKNWISIDPDAEVTFPLSRRDLDHLFFSYAQLGASLLTLQISVRALSRQEMIVAETALRTFCRCQ